MEAKKKGGVSASNFTSGPIVGPLLRFVLPVLLALILQALYGAVDLLIVGQFADKADISAVSTGSQLMQTATNAIASFSIGTTVLLGQQIGMGRGKEGGRIVGASICLFALLGIAVTLGFVAGAYPLAEFMHAPQEALKKTADYIRICGAGSLVIIAYNLIGSIFRGIGDSRTPLITVAIATVVNIFGDLFNVAVLHQGAAGAASATVLAQTVSVILSLLLIRRKQLPFEFHRRMIHFDHHLIRRVTILGLPVGLQDLLVGMSFLVIAMIVNSLGVVISAGVGVAEKVCAFVMLIPSAFAQSLAAIVAQNYGARKMDRAFRTLRIAIGLSLCAGLVMFVLAFFHGSLLTGIFSNDAEVVAAGTEYLKAYAIDCLLTAFLFCFIGFFNGIGYTRFVMIQGLIGAFCVRIPVSWLMSKVRPVSLLRIGLATPCSSAVQIILCLVCMAYVRRRLQKDREKMEGNKEKTTGENGR